MIGLPNLGFGDAPQAGRRYTIQCASRPNLVLDASGNPADRHKIIVWGPHGGNNQKWELQAGQNGAFSIINVDSRGTLEIPNGTNGQAGTQLHVNQPNGTINEQWLIRPQNNNTYSVQSAYNQLALNIAGGSYKQGDKVVLWKFEGLGNDTWKFIPTN